LAARGGLARAARGLPRARATSGTSGGAGREEKKLERGETTGPQYKKKLYISISKKKVTTKGKKKLQLRNRYLQDCNPGPLPELSKP